MICSLLLLSLQINRPNQLEIYFVFLFNYPLFYLDNQKLPYRNNAFNMYATHDGKPLSPSL